ncbi:hypothetical protein V2W45_1353664, partial [Cenococcum geophilum]
MLTLNGLEASKRFTKRWFIAELPSKDLFPPTKLPLLNSVDYEMLPRMQLTTFACGGIVAGVKIAHALANAQSMVTFMQDWSSV